MNTAALFFLLILINFALSSSLQAQGLQLDVENVRNAQGKLIVFVFDKPEGYASLESDKVVYHSLVSMTPSKGKNTIQITPVPEGQYAIVVIHDENANGELDTGAFDIPTEGYALSGQGHKQRSPEFSDLVIPHKAPPSDTGDKRKPKPVASTDTKTDTNTKPWLTQQTLNVVYH